ncbi:hypothetical protein NQ314_020861 [Rhamnusium bicolor]|uniref:Uncharacterized protein n=1 Tax=Rhamnusium bicolor TaxID=1586634 RepID=A0AAV8WJG4_9CUCU|nr:hypothetical protein NQ314_020861 [Rhamnusium bicolor]
MASFWYDKISNKYSVSPEDDDTYDNGTDEEYIEANDSEEPSFSKSDYAENDYIHETEIQGRQLPESGEAKSKVRKAKLGAKLKRSPDIIMRMDLNFFQKVTVNMIASPHIKHDGSSDNSIYSHDVCPVRQGHCVAMQKQYYFMKRKHPGKCWKLDVRAVKVGCKCIPASPI